MEETAYRRLYDKVIKGSVDNCWIWTGCTGAKSPYGVIRFKGKQTTVHRVAYELEYGLFDYSLQVCHKCDNPKCVNPKHLFLGTCLDNARDRVRKGRQSKKSYLGDQTGELNRGAKLTNEKVKEIKRLLRDGVSQTKIAKMFKVDHANISCIKRGISWKHIS